MPAQKLCWGPVLAWASRAVQALTVLIHIALAIAALRLLPRGFPIGNPRFLANQLAPWLVLGVSLLAGAVLALRPRAAASWLAAYPSAWLGSALSSAWLFPVTGKVVVTFASGGAVLLAFGWLGLFSAYGAARVATVAAACLGLALGVALSLCQRAPEPTTFPLAQRPAPVSMSDGAAQAGHTRDALQLSAQVRVIPDELRIDVALGGWHVRVQPMLVFESRSPDRFWTVFAQQPAAQRALTHERTTNGAALFWDDGPYSSLQVVALASGPVRIESWSEVSAPVYSHLNSFTTISVEGHTRLGLRFSPCPTALIEVRRSEYPSGAPARFAYVDEREVFRVVQATDAEKGPFAMLGEGHLGRAEPLAVSLVEMGANAPRLVATLIFEDWSAELSTALSPTAGFGVAENAIEFGLESADAAAPAYLIFTLAGTGVGRGWDSVGHRAGFYRNRITLQAGK